MSASANFSIYLAEINNLSPALYLLHSHSIHKKEKGSESSMT